MTKNIYVFSRLIVLCLALLASRSQALYEVSELKQFTNPTDAFFCAISDNGSYAAVASDSNSTVTIYKTGVGAVLGTYTLPAGKEVESMSFSKDGKYLYIGVQSDSVVCINNSGVLQWTSGIGVFPDEVCVHKPSDVAVLYVAASDYFKRLNLVTNTVTASVVIDTRGWTIWGVDSSADGSVVLLQTNSDVIIVNSAGTETGFFDVCSGNNLASADLSPDGTMFAAAYYDTAASARKVAVYKIGTGMIWSKTIGNTANVVIDENNNVYCALSSGDNILFGPSGGEILTWPAYSRWMAVTPDGSMAICNDSGNNFKIFGFKDVYTCYPDIKVRAYLTNVQPYSATLDRYTITVTNWADLPVDLFVPSPELPACGLNLNAGRTYVDIFGDDGSYYFSGCGSRPVGSFPSQFTFVASNSVPLSNNVYIKFYDRKCDQYFYTNYMDGSSVCPIGDLNGDCTVDLIDFSLMAANWLASN